MAQISATLTEVTFPVFTTLRAYALSRRMWLSIFIFVLSVIEVVAPMVRPCVSLLGSYLYKEFQVAFIVYPVLGIYSSTWGCIGGTAVPLSSDPLGQM